MIRILVGWLVYSNATKEKIRTAVAGDSPGSWGLRFVVMSDLGTGPLATCEYEYCKTLKKKEL